MALGKLPYRYRLVGPVTLDGNNAPGCFLEVRDANNSVRLAAQQIWASPTATIAEINETFQRPVTEAMLADAGSVEALLTSMVANDPTKALALPDPAFVPYSVTLNGLVSQAWTNMPAAPSELPVNSRFKLDLSLASQIRFVGIVLTQGFAGSILGLQYSADSGTNWAFFDPGTNGPNIACNPAGSKDSPWVNIPAAAKTDVLIRIGGQGGNGTIDPAFGFLALQVR